MNIDISIIIPFLNERENLADLVAVLSGHCAKNKTLVHEIIFVDDGSSDGSFDLLRSLPHNNYRPKLIRFSKNYGSHAALRAGILHAEGKTITFYYADMQDPPEVISQMQERMNGGNDIVWATREKTEVGFRERTFSKAYASLMRRYAIADFPESGFDVVMFNKKIQQQLNNNIESNSSLFLQILNLGFKQDSISYHRQQRKKGRSKWTPAKKIKLFVDSFVAFSYAPIRFVTVAGFLFFVLGMIWTIYIILRKFLVGDLVSGWPALVSILMVGFGITNISLGIIAEYLWRTLDASRKRPTFVIDELISLTDAK